ncbi:MAG: hypothetical protein O3B31_10305 [Chloroflexi bacterium]|nr:hypothetical protein [Chloroflexota bacterium]MDA1003720.1 hypothetical protein [Chloroflexota bacterium]
MHQADAFDAFRLAGIHALNESDAVAQALMDLIGTPVLHEALSPAGDRLTVEVFIGTSLSGRRVFELALPERVLVLLVRRGQQEIIPSGTTQLLRGDRMLLWGKADSVREARTRLVEIE